MKSEFVWMNGALVPTERATVSRNSSIRWTAALRAIAGSVAEAIATPKIPSGSCMNRKA